MKKSWTTYRLLDRPRAFRYYNRHMEQHTTSTTTALRPGMIVRVHQKIKDVGKKGEEKERIQVFEGTIIAVRHGNEPGATFTVRKISEGIGVEKIFPKHSPVIDHVEVLRTLRVRRAKLHYLRDPKFKRRMEEVGSTSFKK